MESEASQVILQAIEQNHSVFRLRDIEIRYAPIREPPKDMLFKLVGPNIDSNQNNQRTKNVIQMGISFIQLDETQPDRQKTQSTTDLSK